MFWKKEVKKEVPITAVKYKIEDYTVDSPITMETVTITSKDNIILLKLKRPRTYTHIVQHSADLCTGKILFSSYWDAYGISINHAAYEQNIQYNNEIVIGMVVIDDSNLGIKYSFNIDCILSVTRVPDMEKTTESVTLQRLVLI